MGTAYSAHLSTSQAARRLGVSAERMRQLCAGALIECSQTPGGQWRIPAEAIEELQQGGLPELPPLTPETQHPNPAAGNNGISSTDKPRRSNRREELLAPPSDRLVEETEELRQDELRLERLRVRRQIAEQEEWFDEQARRQQRREKEDQGREAWLKRQEQLQEEQLSSEIEREREQTKEVRRRREWGADWLAHGLERAWDAPAELKVEVKTAVNDALRNLDPDDGYLVQEVIDSTVDRVIGPWRRDQEIERVIDYGAGNNEDAIQAARKALSRLDPETPLDKIEDAVEAAVRPLRDAKEHGRRVEELVSSVYVRGGTVQELEWARRAVRCALSELSIGCSAHLMHEVRSRIVERIEAEVTERKAQAENRERAEGCANLALHQVDGYVRQLEERGEIELRNWLDRWQLVQNLQSRLQPLLVEELVKHPDLSDEEVRTAVVRLVQRHLDEFVE